MTVFGTPVVAWAAGAALLLLAAGMVLALARLVYGPTLPDRVVALDLMSVLAVGAVAAFTVLTGHTVYLDAAIVLALISFLGTVAFARYITLRGVK